MIPKEYSEVLLSIADIVGIIGAEVALIRHVALPTRFSSALSRKWLWSEHANLRHPVTESRICVTDFAGCVFPAT
jgi:hypothetical protein